jgi:hypothetical protein
MPGRYRPGQGPGGGRAPADQLEMRGRVGGTQGGPSPRSVALVGLLHICLLGPHQDRIANQPPFRIDAELPANVGPVIGDGRRPQVERAGDGFGGLAFAQETKDLVLPRVSPASDGWVALSALRSVCLGMRGDTWVCPARTSSIAVRSSSTPQSLGTKPLAPRLSAVSARTRSTYMVSINTLSSGRTARSSGRISRPLRSGIEMSRRTHSGVSWASSSSSSVVAARADRAANRVVASWLGGNLQTTGFNLMKARSSIGATLFLVLPAIWPINATRAHVANRAHRRQSRHDESQARTLVRRWIRRGLFNVGADDICLPWQ